MLRLEMEPSGSTTSWVRCLFTTLLQAVGTSLHLRGHPLMAILLLFPVDGAQWTDSRSNVIHVWNGTQWADVIASGNDAGLTTGSVIGLIMGLS